MYTLLCVVFTPLAYATIDSCTALVVMRAPRQPTTFLHERQHATVRLFDALRTCTNVLCLSRRRPPYQTRSRSATVERRPVIFFLKLFSLSYFPYIPYNFFFSVCLPLPPSKVRRALAFGMHTHSRGCSFADKFSFL